MYGSVGFACGIIVQGITNLIMTAKRYTSYIDASFILVTYEILLSFLPYLNSGCVIDFLAYQS
jgi:hypothetical protein